MLLCRSKRVLPLAVILLAGATGCAGGGWGPAYTATEVGGAPPQLSATLTRHSEDRQQAVIRAQNQYNGPATGYPQTSLPSRNYAAPGAYQAPGDYPQSGAIAPRQNPPLPGDSSHLRYPMTSGGSAPGGQAGLGFAPPPSPAVSANYQPPNGQPRQADAGVFGPSGNVFENGHPTLGVPSNYLAPEDNLPPPVPAEIGVIVTETRTGRFIFGMGVNSDAGVTGQIIVDERNFDWTAVPTSFDDWINGRAFRGGGQGFRAEALPGNLVQRYMVTFSEPYLMQSDISMDLSAFFFNRRFVDWDEERLGGNLGFGYRLRPDLSVGASIRAESVDISRPRVVGVPELDAVLGDHDLFSGRLVLSHDTRDSRFAPTEGYFLQLSYEQVFGDFDYPRAEIDYRKYFLIRQRSDTSGRHTLSYSFRLGFSGAQTPLFENFFAGGHSTMRGFDFREASPRSGIVTVGGEFRFLGSVEYLFPLTADDMIKGVFFCDYGTVEESISIHADDYRVAPGFGIRLSVPALGPAPLSLDFAFPIIREDTDDVQVFSFFFGFGRQ